MKKNNFVASVLENLIKAQAKKIEVLDKLNKAHIQHRKDIMEAMKDTTKTVQEIQTELFNKWFEEIFLLHNDLSKVDSNLSDCQIRYDYYQKLIKGIEEDGYIYGHSYGQDCDGSESFSTPTKFKSINKAMAACDNFMEWSDGQGYSVCTKAEAEAYCEEWNRTLNGEKLAY